MHRHFLASLCTISVTLLLAAPGEAQRPPKMAGNIYFTHDTISDQSPKALMKVFASRKPAIELPRDQTKRWKVTLVGFFRKEAFAGPMTIWLYDKADKGSIKARDPVQVFSVEARPSKVFVHELDIDPNLGFNKNRTYLIQVGQIIRKKPQIYASGEVSLKP